MQSDDQNRFYTSISKHYSEIFPFKPAQLRFVTEKVGNLNGQSILDIGCATGQLSVQMAKAGAKVTGIDLNEDLLAQATDSLNREPEFATPGPKFQKGDMLELTNDFNAAEFDAVLCFGNTLVHLQTKELVGKMLEGAYTVLKSVGKLLIQILNYDYILAEPVTELPLIETENIKFVRNYKFTENSPLIRFQTGLHLKKQGQVISNETTLLALRSSELRQLLKDAGFSNIQLYANFKQDDFAGKHLPLVLSCEKV